MNFLHRLLTKHIKSGMTTTEYANITSFWKKNIIKVCVLFILLLLPSFYALHNAIDLEYSFIKKITYLFVVIILLLLPALVFKARTYFIVEGIFNFLLFPIDIASLYLNRQSTSTAFLMNIIHTDLHESLELITSFWPLSIAVIFLWIVYFVIAVHVENQYIILGGGAFAFIIGFIIMTTLMRPVSAGTDTTSTMHNAIGLMWKKLYKIYPYNLYVEANEIIHLTHYQHKLEEQIREFSFGLKPHNCNQPSIYVLVLGEAARYDHFSLNGYSRETTPHLAILNNLISFDSTFSQANLTSLSIPTILTRATAQDMEKAYSEKSLSGAFREAGFYTGYINKQVPLPFTRRVMDECAFSYCYNKGMDVFNNYDEDMISKLAELHNDSSMFMILHSAGCHFRYELRYPDDFSVFLPVLGQSFSYSSITEANKDKLINAYDNAILYTDYFLNKLITYLDSLDKPATMVYISDHGESFWDDDRKLSLHGSYQISEYEYHVPLLVWYSDEYEKQYPQKVANMWKNKTTPVSSDVVFYSMLDIAGIEDVVDSARSICSPYLLPYDTIWVHTGSGAIEPIVVR